MAKVVIPIGALSEEELEYRKRELYHELAEIEQAAKAIEVQRNQKVLSILAEKAKEITRLYREAQSLAEGIDVQFYFAEGYDEVIFDPHTSWDSSRC